MKRIYTLSLLACLFLAASATRPLQRFFLHEQSDGTTVQVMKAGNAFFNYFLTPDGITLLPSANGDLCYALSDATGRVYASSILAHNAAERTATEAEELIAAKVITRARARSLSISLHKQYALRAAAPNSDGTCDYGSPSAGTSKSQGAPIIPVIMVEFPNRAFQDTTTIEKVSRLFNERGYSDEKYCKGSVKDYFESQSGGLYQPTFKVVAKVETMLGYEAYGNRASGGTVAATKSLLREALDGAVEQGIDFSEFKDEAGNIQLVSIYYAGPGAHSAFETGHDKYIWAHYQNVANLRVQGISVNGCFVGNELLQSYDNPRSSSPQITGAQTDGIGVFCHEFGHALGLPDFYYTGSDSDIEQTLLSMDYWSVMDYGQYCYDGYAPVGYNAYERAMLGWQKITELEDEDHYQELLAHADATETDATCFRIKNPQNPAEYFLLENRQAGTWYPSFMGHGMLITHVDYDAARWSSNILNNQPSHQRFTYVPADGEKQGVNSGANFSQTKGDLFPGTEGVTTFSHETHPTGAFFYTDEEGGSASGYDFPLYDITEDGRIVRFVYRNRDIVGISTPATTSSAHTAASAYSLDGRRIDAESYHGIYLQRTPQGTWHKVMRQ